MKPLLSSLLLLTALPFGAGANPPPPRAPPQAAFDACVNLAQGTACQVSTPDGAVSGTCEAFPDAGQLACRPARPPGPPPEAVEACVQGQAGDPCQVMRDGHALTGTCEAGPDAQGELACRPPWPPPRR